MNRARQRTSAGPEVPASGPLERSTTAILEGWSRCTAAAAHRLRAIGAGVLSPPPAAATAAEARA